MTKALRVLKQNRSILKLILKRGIIMKKIGLNSFKITEEDMNDFCSAITDYKVDILFPCKFYKYIEFDMDVFKDINICVQHLTFSGNSIEKGRVYRGEASYMIIVRDLSFNVLAHELSHVYLWETEGNHDHGKRFDVVNHMIWNYLICFFCKL